MATKTAARRAGSSSRRSVPRAQRRPSTGATVEAVVVALAVIVAGLLFARASRDAFNLPRATVLVLLALFQVGWWVTGWLRGRPPVLPRRGPVLAAALFALLGLLSVAVAETRWIALIGPASRLTGAVPYLAYVVLFVAAASLRRDQWHQVARIAAAVFGVVVLYGMIQILDADPLTWGRQEGDQLSVLFSTFGQINFASGYCAITLPFALYVALDRGERPWARALAVVAVAMGVYYLLDGADSFQGVVAGALGVVPLAVFALSRLLRERLDLPARRLAVVLAGGALVLVLLLVAVPGVRTALTDDLESGLQERVLLWEAALDMAGDAPILGRGLGGYGDDFPEFRPAEHGRKYGDTVADDPHSVPLNLLVSGGVLLLGAYLAFVALVGWRLVSAARREPEPLLLALGGAWLAYQVQSLVSFDVPALAVHHWLLAGGILVLTSPPREPGPAARRPVVDAQTTNVLIGGVVVVGLVAAWLVLRPLRADVVAQDGRDLISRQELVAASTDLRRATSLAPWQGVYWADLATVRHLFGDDAEAIAAGNRAIATSPGSIQYYVAMTDLHTVAKDLDGAVDWWNRALETDRRNPLIWRQAARWAVLHRPALAREWFAGAIDRDPENMDLASEASLFEVDRGELDVARRVIEAALDRGPATAQAWTTLGDVELAEGRRDAAIRAYERALELDPSYDTAANKRAAELAK